MSVAGIVPELLVNVGLQNLRTLDSIHRTSSAWTEGLLCRMLQLPLHVTCQLFACYDTCNCPNFNAAYSRHVCRDIIKCVHGSRLTGMRCHWPAAAGCPDSLLLD